MASAVDSRLAYARLSAVATASRLPTATRGSNNSYTTSWDRPFFQAASGAVAFASLPHVLRRAGIAAEEPIRVGNILDKSGILNIYSLKQISAAAMAVDEINAAGGLLGRPLEHDSN